jgi:cystathionine beta-lyase/cystathionine gamma-synthase
VKALPFRDYGPAISPFNALMTLSDLRTLRGRIDLMSRNTMKVARFLEEHPKVEAVQYPGLESFRGHEVARRYMWLADGEDDYGKPVNRYGHLMSFCVKGGAAAARRVLDAFALIFRATDLGRIKSLATIPAISTHQQQGEEGRALADVPANLIRLNVGGEHPDDLIADLDQALGHA